MMTMMREDTIRNVFENKKRNKNINYPEYKIMNINQTVLLKYFNNP